MSIIKSFSTRLLVLASVGTCIATLILTHREQQRRVKNGRKRSNDDGSNDKEPKFSSDADSGMNVLISRFSDTTRRILRSMTREVSKWILCHHHSRFKLISLVLSTVDLSNNIAYEDIDYNDVPEDNGFTEDHKHRGPFYPHQNQFIRKHFPTRDSFNLMEELPCNKVSDEVVNNDDEDTITEFEKKGQ